MRAITNGIADGSGFLPAQERGVVAMARTFMGAPFRLHGRGADGLDCVGLAACVFGAEVPTGYRRRRFDLAGVVAGATAAGLVAVRDMDPGDLVAMTAGPGQLHLGIWTGDGLVHADATLGRVVERPGVAPWPVVGIWRLPFP